MSDFERIEEDRLKDMRFAKLTYATGLVLGYVVEIYAIAEDRLDLVIAGAGLIVACAVGHSVMGDKEEGARQQNTEVELFSVYEREFE